MTTVLVTGGAGFIGSNLVLELVNQGYNVRVLDNFTTGNTNNLSEVRNKIEIIKGDIRDIKLVRKSVKDIDYILHEAAEVSVQRSIEDPYTTNDVNVNGTLNILLAARDSNVKRIIYASSCAVYGDTKNLPIKENEKPNPLSIYALTKLIGEKYCDIFYRLYGLENVILRYFNVYGPRQSPDSPYAAVIPIFIKKLSNNEQPIIYGDGEQSRDFVFVKDVVQANILAMKKENIANEIFNISYGNNTTINQLFITLNKILGKDIKPKYGKARTGDIKHSLGDITKAREILNYEPKYSLEDGLKEMVSNK